MRFSTRFFWPEARGWRWTFPWRWQSPRCWRSSPSPIARRIYAYPRGGGSYTVARENLGIRPGLVAAAALMVDYLTTVAVSVTAGVAAIVAFIPGLNADRVVLDVALIVVLIAINLRGVRDSGAAFVLPTYAFIGSLGALLVVGAVHLITQGAPAPAHPIPAASQSLSFFLVLRAFAGGCTAMTGVEAIANGVPAFNKPASKNAAGTLVTLALILGVLFLGWPAWAGRSSRFLLTSPMWSRRSAAPSSATLPLLPGPGVACTCPDAGGQHLV